MLYSTASLYLCFFLTSRIDGSAYNVTPSGLGHKCTDGSGGICNIYCDLLRGTKGVTFDCANAGECNFYCGEQRCATNAVITASNSTNLNVVVGPNGQQCLRSATIYAPDNGNATLDMGNSVGGFIRTKVYAGNSTQNIIININSTQTTGKDADFLEVHASTADNVRISVSNGNEWSSGILYCPLLFSFVPRATAPCVVDASDGILTDVNIYAPDGMPYNFWIFEGTYAGTNTLYCANVDGYNGATEGGSSVAPFTVNSDCWWTSNPTASPSYPTINPSKHPTRSPTLYPTQAPSYAPSQNPSHNPTAVPSSAPSLSGTISPTVSTTAPTTISPTKNPTNAPSTSIPTSANPTNMPSTEPTLEPTVEPTTAAPTRFPSKSPTSAPITANPSTTPTALTAIPTLSPTTDTIAPTDGPTYAPTMDPSANPTLEPTFAPKYWICDEDCYHQSDGEQKLQITITYSFSQDVIYDLDNMQCFLYQIFVALFEKYQFVDTFTMCDVKVDGVSGGTEDTVCEFSPCLRLRSDATSHDNRRVLLQNNADSTSSTMSIIVYDADTYAVINSLSRKSMRTKFKTAFMESFGISMEFQISVKNGSATSSATELMINPLWYIIGGLVLLLLLILCLLCWYICRSRRLQRQLSYKQSLDPEQAEGDILNTNEYDTYGVEYGQNNAPLQAVTREITHSEPRAADPQRVEMVGGYTNNPLFTNESLDINETSALKSTSSASKLSHTQPQISVMKSVAYTPQPEDSDMSSQPPHNYVFHQTFHHHSMQRPPRSGSSRSLDGAAPVAQPATLAMTAMYHALPEDKRTAAPPANMPWMRYPPTMNCEPSGSNHSASGSNRDLNQAMSPAQAQAVAAWNAHAHYQNMVAQHHMMTQQQMRHQHERHHSDITDEMKRKIPQHHAQQQHKGDEKATVQQQQSSSEEEGSGSNDESDTTHTTNTEDQQSDTYDAKTQFEHSQASQTTEIYHEHDRNTKSGHLKAAIMDPRHASSVSKGMLDKMSKMLEFQTISVDDGPSLHQSQNSAQTNVTMFINDDTAASEVKPQNAHAQISSVNYKNLEFLPNSGKLDVLLDGDMIVSDDETGSVLRPPPKRKHNMSKD